MSLKAIEIFWIWLAESVAGRVVQLRRGKLMVLGQNKDLRGKPHTCGKLRASSTTFAWRRDMGSTVKSF